MTISKTYACGILMFSFSCNASASNAENLFVEEVVTCAAYYKLSSNVLNSMNTPQMKGVADRLQASYLKAMQIATKYDNDANSKFAIKEKEQNLEFKSSGSLKELMARNRTKCQQLLSDPEKRLTFLEMKEM